MPLPPRTQGDYFEQLKAISVSGDEIAAAGDTPIAWAWDQAAPVGGTILLAAGPGAGKTMLAFLLMACRAQTNPIDLLGRTVFPAPPGQWIVIIEMEHSPRSAARRMLRALGLLALKTLPRTLIVCKDSVRVGDAKWQWVSNAIKAGLVSDVVLDTIASTTTEKANDEQEQINLFNKLKVVQRTAPDTSPLTFWILAHLRKSSKVADDNVTMEGVSGSAQRTGQVDTVILATADRDKETRKVKSVSLVFEKTREEPTDPYCEDGIPPIKYRIHGGKLYLLSETVAKKRLDRETKEKKLLDYLEMYPKQIHTVKSLSVAGLGGKTLVQEMLEKFVKEGQVGEETKDVSGNPTKVFSRKKRGGGTLALVPPPRGGGTP
jgi:AAA domain